ncbi:MAG TPA: hypothetical protein VHO68_07655 [Bacteroidales bacterium]|nr:hypothetical protein [Bacteroidales bacterium]
METEEIKKNSGGKVALIAAVSVIAAFLIYYMVMVMLSPGRKLDELKAEYKPAGKEGVSEKIPGDSTYLSLLREKAWAQSKVAMAQNDSIYMTINLSDSTSNLEISGVSVFSTKISSYEMSTILRKCDQSVILNMLSTPLTIESAFATLKKEPVMIKVAPKDTSEYEPDIMPDTSLIDPVNYILEMKNGFRIYVYQEETNTAPERKAQFRFDLTDRISTAVRCLKSVMSFKVPEYHPYIKIKIPRDDGKIIYRAIPRNGQIAIYT